MCGTVGYSWVYLVVAHAIQRPCCQCVWYFILILATSHSSALSSLLRFQMRNIFLCQEFPFFNPNSATTKLWKIVKRNGNNRKRRRTNPAKRRQTSKPFETRLLIGIFCQPCNPILFSEKAIKCVELYQQAAGLRLWNIEKLAKFIIFNDIAKNTLK